MYSLTRAFFYIRTRIHNPLSSCTFYLLYFLYLCLNCHVTSFVPCVNENGDGWIEGVCVSMESNRISFLPFFFWPYTSRVEQARASWKGFGVLFLSFLPSLHSFVFSSNAGIITLETAAEFKNWTLARLPPSPHLFQLLRHPVSLSLRPSTPPPLPRLPCLETRFGGWGTKTMQTTQQAKGTNNALQTSHVRHWALIIMYIFHALINALSAHMIHINLNMNYDILYTCRA